MEKVQTVEMTAEELEQFRAYKTAQEEIKAAERAKSEREAYKQLVDETINTSLPILQQVSADIAKSKQSVIDNFRRALELKEKIFDVRSDQRSHSFTNSECNKRIILGVYQLDNYRDTVSEGISIVEEYLASLAKDTESKALVKLVLKLLAKDQSGNLKASRVLQLSTMAEESGNPRFIEGVRIIKESYQPMDSKQYIRAEYKNDKGVWVNIPLAMTEAQ